MQEIKQKTKQHNHMQTKMKPNTGLHTQRRANQQNQSQVCNIIDHKQGSGAQANRNRTKQNQNAMKLTYSVLTYLITSTVSNIFDNKHNICFYIPVNCKEPSPTTPSFCWMYPVTVLYAVK